MKLKNTLIIAEAGVNHNGSLDIAFKLIDAASDAGADLVKFQTFQAEKLVTEKASKADYQKATTGSEESQFDMIKKLELSPEDHDKLISYCNDKNIGFFSTGFDIDSLNMLIDLKLDLIKVPSGEITNLPYLRHVGSLGKPVIMSTGMANLHEVGEALNVLEESGVSKENVCILHCNTEYPTPIKDVNLRAMLKIKETFGVDIGYSDHTLGIEVSTAAVALGAKVIEKHLTLDRGMSGPDHAASLEAKEFALMVTAIRNIEKALGSYEKKPSPSELKNIAIVRKSLVAASFIKKGTLFSSDNLNVKRPGVGISPMKWDEVIGMTANKDYEKDELIRL
tara:strand:- start:954 stop:1964 length:1011 start_codon:yes stop_codon:yes gene_type:complete